MRNSQTHKKDIKCRNRRATTTTAQLSHPLIEFKVFIIAFMKRRRSQTTNEHSNNKMHNQGNFCASSVYVCFSEIFVSNQNYAEDTKREEEAANFE